VHIAAVLLLGPWGAVVVAVAGVLVVDCLRASEFRRLAFNASTFALSSLAAGAAYLAAGGVPGALNLPADFVAIAAMAVAYLATNRLLIAIIVSLTSPVRLRHVVAEALRTEVASASAEISLGVAVAFFVFADAWQMVVLAPLVFAVYQAHIRLARLHSETAHAMETLANVVDERDPYTYQHSVRVADSVERLASRLEIPTAEAARLRWAARLHDLGKIAVDAATLRKRGPLSPEEKELIRRHPRLSARMLLRFQLATAVAQAVEYHHERYDGKGYYGLGGDEVPLAAHFLVVADSYDAMVSDRSYRRGLTREAALAEIEAGSGKQFHPLVAKAFVALERDDDPLSVLTAEEADRLRSVSLRTNRSRLLRRARLEELTVAGLVAAVAAAGVHRPLVALPGLLAALAGTFLVRSRDAARRRLAASLSEALSEPRDPEARFRSFVDRLAATAPVGWSGLVRWDDQRLAGVLEQQVSFGRPGAQLAHLTSWLVRERESAEGLVLADGREFGEDGIYGVAPLASEGTVAGFVVVAFNGPPASHVELALSDSLTALASLLAVAPPTTSLRLAAAGP